MHQQQPHANEINEHYCRQWMAIKTLQRTTKESLDYAFDIQISDYADSGQHYLVFTSATKDPFRKYYYRSIRYWIFDLFGFRKKDSLCK